MISFGNTSDYVYAFSAGKWPEFPPIELTRRELVPKSKGEYRRMLVMRRSDLVEFQCSIEIDFAEPVGMVDFSSLGRHRVFAPGRYVFQVVTVCLPAPKYPVYPKPQTSFHGPYNYTGEAIIRLLGSDRQGVPPERKETLALVSGTTMGKSLQGVEIEQQIQHRRWSAELARWKLLQVLEAAKLACAAVFA